jgi:Domain of unknown function (DUF1905)/Bacteriocin-protection, YdeI or OmpD-Associated
MAGSRAKRFQAVLEKGDRALGWTIARVPFDPAEVWQERIRLRVKGEVNGFGFRTSLFPDPANPGRFFVLVSRAMQVGAGVGLGGAAEFRLEADLEPREAELPDELAVLLEEEAGLREWYGELSESMRREIGRWIVGVKSDAARMRRSEQMAERLLATMEAEVELPPVIEAAFRLHPKARAGWARMTPTQRRRELLGVFYYQTVEARQRRVDKLCAVAEKH